MEELLELLEQDGTLSPGQLAAATGRTPDEVRKMVKELEEDRTILGYQAVVDWSRLRKDSVTALIEVKVVPQSVRGFDRIAERIYQYDEVESMFLMSGAFDLAVIVAGDNLRQVALFVSERLSTIEGVTGTSTHFILRKYKERNLVFRPKEPEEKEYIFT